MAEYIEREALIKDVSELEVAGVFTESLKNEVLKIISEQATADVAEVRHGKWIRKENTKVYWYACSLCGEKVPKNEYGNDYWSDYCPRCGTIMDLGDDEE